MLACITSEELFGAEFLKEALPLGNITYSTYLLQFGLQLTRVFPVDMRLTNKFSSTGSSLSASRDCARTYVCEFPSLRAFCAERLDQRQSVLLRSRRTLMIE
jgi:hypothetical protein